MILAAILLIILPAHGNAGKGRIEDFTVEKTESGYTVVLPEEHAEQGYYKLFWMNRETGEIRKDVITADTPSYEIRADEGTEYSFALFYAKKRGALPASWDGDKPKEPKGPYIWKMLWINAETIDIRGINNHLSEANHLGIDRAAKDFEALVEEFTDGLVDIQITRISVDEPVTGASYVQQRGYIVESADINADHYARYQYDSVFVFGRMDGIYITYGGVTVKPDSPTNDPGYSFIALIGDDPNSMGDANMAHVCVHEWLHQLGFYYDWFKLEIPDPDKPDAYGYEADATLDLQMFRDALTMKTRTQDGKYIGIPAEAWQYKPGKRPAKWDLSYLQDQTVPEDLRLPEKEPVAEETEEPAVTDKDPEIFGMLDEDRIEYENKVMGLNCRLENWIWYTPEEYFATYTIKSIVTSEEEAANFTDSFLVIFAEDSEGPRNIRLEMSYPTESFLGQYDEAAYLEHLKELLEQYAPEAGLDDYTCEIVQRQIGNRTLSGLKSSFTTYGIKNYMTDLMWMEGGQLNQITAVSYMFDECDDILAHFRTLEKQESHQNNNSYISISNCFRSFPETPAWAVLSFAKTLEVLIPRG